MTGLGVSPRYRLLASFILASSAVLGAPPVTKTEGAPVTATTPAPVPVAPPAEPAAAPSPEPAEPPPAPAAPSASAAPPLPDPATWKQEPAPVLERPAPVPHVPKLELGVDTGIASRPSKGSLVHYGLSWAVGGHARVNVARWLGARVHARFEGNSVTFDDGALGLPSGTRYDSPNFHRVLLGFALEPTFTPIPPLDLWLGLGVSWSRTTVGILHTSGAESVVLPIRSAVFVEFPVSIGLRYHVVPRWLVLNLMGAASFLTNQSGRLESDYDTPGASGLTLVRVGGFPGFGTSFTALAGVGVLL